MREAESVSELVQRHRREVDAARRRVHRPGLGFVEVCVARDVSAVGRWIEAVGQDAARAVEWRTVPVVSALPRDAHVPAAVRFREHQRRDRGPTVEGSPDRRALIGLAKVGRVVVEAVGHVVARPLVSLRDEGRHGPVVAGDRLVRKPTSRLLHELQRRLVEDARHLEALLKLELEERRLHKVVERRRVLRLEWNRWPEEQVPRPQLIVREVTEARQVPDEVLDVLPLSALLQRAGRYR